MGILDRVKEEREKRLAQGAVESPTGLPPEPVPYPTHALAVVQANLVAARAKGDQDEVGRQLGEAVRITNALLGDFTATIGYLRESLEVGRLEDDQNLDHLLGALVDVERRRGDPAAAASWCAEALANNASYGHSPLARAGWLCSAGEIQWWQGDLPGARRSFDEVLSIGMARRQEPTWKQGWDWPVGGALARLAGLDLEEMNVAGAQVRLRDAVELAAKLDVIVDAETGVTAFCICVAIGVANASGQFARALSLAACLRELFPYELSTADWTARLRRWMEPARLVSSGLDREQRIAATAEGLRMSRDGLHVYLLEGLRRSG